MRYSAPASSHSLREDALEVTRSATQRRRDDIIVALGLAFVGICVATAVRANDEEDIEVMRIVAFDPGTLPDDATAFGESIDLTRYQGEHKRLEDVLAQSVGVQIRRFGGAGERAEVSIRGFSSSQVRVELDGVALNGGRSRGVDLASVPLSQLEAVEVIRGGSAVGGGNAAMGGLVRLRTRRPDFPSGEVRVQAASFGTIETSLHATRPGDRVDLGFGYSGFRTQGDYEFARIETQYADGASLTPDPASAERINNDRQRHDAHLSVGFDLGERGYLLAQQLVGYQDGGEPGLDREGESGPSAGQQLHAEQERLRTISQLRLEAVEIPGPMGTFETALAHRHETSDFRDDAPSLETRPIDDRFEDAATHWSLRPRWEWMGPYADHTLRVELEFQREAFDVTDARARDRYTTAVALRDEVSIFAGALVLSPGLRFDWNDDTGTHWLPGVGFVATPRPWLRFRGNVTRSFRNPTFEALYLPDRGFTSGNPDLDPERSDHFDLGAEFLLSRVVILRNVEVGASVFRSEIENSIVWLRVSPYKVRPENTGDARVEGFELDASFELGRFLRVFANHTELRAETRPQQTRLPGRAKRETSVRVEWRGSESWKLSGEYQRTGSIPVSNGGLYLLPARDVWNGSLALDLAMALRNIGIEPGMQRLWLNAAVDNIGNIAIRDSLSFPQPGRTVRFGVEATW